ncbi:hypothetical protein VTL71DRAFT_6173 [Oculimacula yallundae]|uniref:Uncharacterized protein n=1 Tax=Oculimacula yallundae TaxID=86028 RepID=A0ABR4BZL0_9HELO
MDGFVDRVVNGRIFRNLASFVRKDNQSSKDIQTLGSINDRTPGAYSECGTPVLARNLSFMSNHTAKNRKRKAGDNSDTRRPETAPDAMRRKSDISLGESFHLASDRFTSSDSQRAPSINNVTPLPLTARYLELFTFPGDDGELGTGLALTDTLVWNLNAVYQAKRKIASYTAMIEEAGEAVVEIRSMIDQFQQMIDTSTAHEDQTSRYESIQEATQLFTERQQEMKRLRARCQHWKSELEIPLSQVLSSLHMVLESNDLKADVLDLSDDGVDADPGPNPLSATMKQAPSPTPSELAHQDAENERQEVFETLRERRFNLQDAQARVDGWNDLYNQEYYQFRQLQCEGVMDGTKTDFDLQMIQRGQEATQGLVQAEEELDEIVKYARLLRLDFEGFDQESGFISQIEDGHVESMDPGEVYNVDRKRIERWMSDDNTTLGDTEVDVDDWDCQTVGACDSVSIVAAQVATGKERKRIDRWRSICGLAEVEQEEDQGHGCA